MPNHPRVAPIVLPMQLETAFERLGRRHCPSCHLIRVVYRLSIVAIVDGGFGGAGARTACAPCHGIR